MFLNQIKTALLLGALSSLLFFLGYIVGGREGIYFAFILSLLFNFITYFFSDKIVLKMYGAKPLDPKSHEDIYTMVGDLASTMKIPMPKLWLINTRMANAFATGRNPNHSSVALTTGIMTILDKHELRAVLSHELSHIKNRDILVATIAATLATAIGYLASILRWSAMFGGRNDDKNRGSGLSVFLIGIFMPLAAMLIQLAVSRSREYLADETGASCCQDPLSLASALEKLHAGVAHDHSEPHTPAEAASASLFIVYPFSGKFWLNLFSTHPPMEKRIERLRKMVR